MLFIIIIKLIWAKAEKQINNSQKVANLNLNLENKLRKKPKMMMMEMMKKK